MNANHDGSPVLLRWPTAAIRLLLAIVITPLLSAETSPSGIEIMQKVVERAKWNEENVPQAGYTYLQHSVREKLDAKGAVKERQDKLFEVFYIEGLMFRRLIQRDGQPLSAEEVQREEQRERDFHKEIPERKQRKAQGPQKDDVALNEELISKYEYTVEDQETLNGRPAYVIAFRPRHDNLPIRRRVDRLLNKLTGRVWIDAEEYEITKLQIHLAEKATVWGGLIASARKLEGEFEQTRTADGVWLPLRIEGYLDARVLFTNHRITQNERFSNFKKTSSQASGNKVGHGERD